jgi:hypothetical protein
LRYRVRDRIGLERGGEAERQEGIEEGAHVARILLA